MVWRAEDPQGNESKKIVWEVAPYLRGRGLDVGAGDFKVLPHVISVDNMHHAQMFGWRMRPDIVSEADDLSMFSACSMDFVYSSHTLEHVNDMQKTLKEWWRVVKQGGYLVMYLPHKDFYPNIGQPGANPDHKRDFRPDDVIEAMPNGWDLLECQERNEDMEYSFLLVFKKTNGKNTYSCKKPRPAKTACVVRYGAFGDVMQASSVFKGLKDQGYHVTVFAAPPGSDVIQYDPNIDNLILFDKDQVPNQNLFDFWKWQAKKYDKFVNLSESVEGYLLALPDRIQNWWSPELRHKQMNKNYLEHQHDVAGIPHKPQIKFYATEGEVEWAKKTRRKLDCEFLIVYSLAGSSVHKTWPGLDNLIASVMLHFPTTKIVLVGGPECAILEAGWENEPRVIKTCGKYTIRQSLALAQQADIVVGPETGVLNAMSCEPMRKVVFLSHSSHENLTRDWVNTVAVWSKETSCPKRPAGVPACHMLHYGWTNCCLNETTSTAQCQADINPYDVWHGVADYLEQLQNDKVK